MMIICRGCERRLEWSAKADKPLRALACPHCGADYRRPPEYKDWSDPRVIVRQANHTAARVELASKRLQLAIEEAAALPELLIQAREQLEKLHEPRLRLLTGQRDAQEGGAA